MKRIKIANLVTRCQSPKVQMHIRDLIFKLTEPNGDVSFYKYLHTMFLHISEKADDQDKVAYESPMLNESANVQDAPLNFKEIIPYIMNESKGHITITVAPYQFDFDDAEKYEIELIKVSDISANPHGQMPR